MRPLLLLFFFFPLISKAQTDTVNNFRIENKELIWQKVFQTNLPANDLSRQFKTNGLFINPEIDSLQMMGELRQFDADYKGAGYSEMIIPIYIARSHFNAFSTVEFKDGKYRVTVKKIVTEQMYNDGLSRQGEKTRLETFAVKGQKLTPGFKKSPSKILDHTFTNLFTVVDTLKNNW